MGLSLNWLRSKTVEEVSDDVAQVGKVAINRGKWVKIVKICLIGLGALILSVALVVSMRYYKESPEMFEAIINLIRELFGLKPVL